MEDIVIIDALRTPIGKYRGQLAQFSAVELGSAVSRALLAKNKKVGPLVDQAIFGNVLQAGNGQNPARQIVINSGLAPTVYATTVNQVCGSGMKAVSLAMEAIRLQKAELILAGGIESMSQAPFLSRYNQQKDSYSDPVPVMIKDGLTDAFSGQHMGLTAENVAQKFHVSRKEQDVLALYSQQKAAAAQEKGYFTAEKINLQTKEGKDINCDEGIRKATSLEKLAALKTVFKEDGTVTAGNASTLNDGAAAMLLASKNFALSQKLPILAEIKDIVEVGIDPSLMGISPIKAIRKLIAATEISLADIDWFEINEAFAASSIVVQRELALAAEKVNPVGSGISIGHAIGATGARIITTACHQLERIKGRYAIASLCVGGGLGLACLIERPSSQEKKHFYQMSKTQRLSQLALQKELSQDQLKDLTQTSLNDQVADHLIENQISEFELPMGVALNLRVNQKDYVVPMATEEPSVIAACSNGAKML
ncbi:MAG TPA: acetyl-CoA C-acyltransferase, partial [Tetragenococcus sp.]|nr:acetyl-CoA C-acyltransferase [Tetragenococcus sp.]